ncbi:hypothetical protein BMS3Bbin16_00548 [archaeon BMS3Bbin16]|nr:hypothetical protein BMS3Bbin16_00548 [archaeon BMS3Bbin16]
MNIRRDKDCERCKEEAKRKGENVDCEKCKLVDYIALDVI